jgi:4-amino-4-deoxy-L-arabinose transferase-like glycosyltransferase
MSPRRIVWFLSIAAVIARVCLSVLFLDLRTTPGLLDFDEQEYYQLAGNLLAGTYEHDPRRTIGHVILIAAYRLLTFDNLVAIQLHPAAMFSTAAPMAFVLLYRTTGNVAVATLTGAAVIFWPPFVFFGATLYSETTALPLFLLFLIMLPRGSLLEHVPHDDRIAWLSCGILLGLCVLVRPMYLLFIPFAVVIIAIEENRWTSVLRRSLILGTGCALIIVSWSLYVSSQTGKPIFVSSNGGETISGGLNQRLLDQGYVQRFTPSGRMIWNGPGKWLMVAESGYLDAEEQHLSQPEQDRLLTQRTAAWVMEHPLSALYLQGAKLAYMWGLYPLNWDKQTLLGSIPTVIAIALSLLALGVFRRSIRRLARLWLLPIFVSCVALISLGSWRYRQPADVALLGLSALFLVSFASAKSAIVMQMAGTVFHGTRAQPGRW